MRVLIVEPGQYPREAEIENTLAAEQKIVDGLIEAIYPWQDTACIVANDEAKLIGLPFNRALGDYDVLAGTFFICGLGDTDFKSLTEEQVQCYEKLYHEPQYFLRTVKGISVIKCTPEEYQGYSEFFGNPKPPRPHKNQPER